MMRDQIDLLEATDWRVLIVLDACRADVFRAVTGRGETVRSPAVCTAGWIAAVGPLLAERDPLYFSANPVVDREVARRGLALELVSVWRDHWGRFTPERIPSVHPMSVNGVVLTHLALGRAGGRPLVVHYLQPHSPYVGAAPLAMSRWGRSGDPFGRACHGLPRPDRAARRGELDWPTLGRAYRANLELAWDAARQLSEALGRAGRASRVVVTSDHGEMLGEPLEPGGPPAFGHEGHWRHALLRTVPWLVVEPASRTVPLRRKLEALGYA